MKLQTISEIKEYMRRFNAKEVPVETEGFELALEVDGFQFAFMHKKNNPVLGKRVNCIVMALRNNPDSVKFLHDEGISDYYLDALIIRASDFSKLDDDYPKWRIVMQGRKDKDYSFVISFAQRQILEKFANIEKNPGERDIYMINQNAFHVLPHFEN